MKRLVLAIFLFTAAASAQLRITPASQEITPFDPINYQISGVPTGVSVSVALNYPAGGRRDWLTATRSSNTITVTCTSACQGFRTGIYVGYLDVTVAGLVTKRALVVLDRVRDEERFRFYQSNQIIGFNGLSITPTSTSVPLTIDYNGNAGTEARNFTLALQVNDAVPQWINVDTTQGKTLAQVNLNINAAMLPARTDPYTATMVAYEPTNPNNQSSMTVKLAVTSGQTGTQLTDQLQPFILGGGSLATGENGFWIDVPAGSTKLEVAATANNPVQLFVRRGQDVGVIGSNIVADASTPGASQQPLLEITTPALQPGRYYVAIRVPGAGGATGNIAGRATAVGNISQGNPIMAQIAAGGPWKTTVVLVNTSDSPSTFSLRFRDESGLDWPVPLLRLGPAQADLGNVSTLSESIPAGAMFTYQTREQPLAPVRSGYAVLTSGTGIRGQAIFQQANPGGFDYEAAVPMAYDSDHFFLPFDNAAATTSAALLSDDADAQITARIRDEGGNLLDTRLLSLTAGQHRADTLAMLLGNAVTGRGTIEFESSGTDIAALGLRFRAAFTSFGVIPAGPVASGGNPVMAQIASGANWKTTLLLVNTTSSPQTFTLRFRQAGNPNWLLPLERVGPNPADLGTQSLLTGTIPAYGMHTYATRDMPRAQVTQGFAELTSGAGIRGQAIFQQTLGGGVVYEAAVPMESGYRRFLVPFDNTTSAGRTTVTSMAMANADPATDASIQMIVRDDNGTTLLSKQVTLSAGQHVADTVLGVASNVVDGKRGTVEFIISGADVNALGLRFRGPFTSFAVIPK